MIGQVRTCRTVVAAMSFRLQLNKKQQGQCLKSRESVEAHTISIRISASRAGAVPTSAPQRSISAPEKFRRMFARASAAGARSHSRVRAMRPGSATDSSCG